MNFRLIQETGETVISPEPLQPEEEYFQEICEGFLYFCRIWGDVPIEEFKRAARQIKIIPINFNGLHGIKETRRVLSFWDICRGVGRNLNLDSVISLLQETISTKTVLDCIMR